MNKVKVSQFRSTTDNLLNLANCHFSSCVGADELKGWIQRLDNALDKAVTQYARAKPDDLEWRDKAYKACSERRKQALTMIRREQGNHLELVK